MSDTGTPTARVWLITGCSSGFGLALASLALARGQKVIATARDLASLADLTERFPDSCRTFPLDVTNPTQVKGAVAAASEAFGRLDVIVNNAGYGVIGAFEELSESQIERNFQTNFFGALAIIREALPIFRAQRAGHIINISAAAVIANYPGFSIYGATKWALEGVSESLAAELKPLGIRVTIIQPGPFRTNFITRSLERAEHHIEDYDRTSGNFLRLLRSMDHKQSGDPAKAVAAIMAAVDSPNPPLRLVLGKYATNKARKKAADTERELTAWQAVGLDTDFA